MNRYNTGKHVNIMGVVEDEQIYTGCKELIEQVSMPL